LNLFGWILLSATEEGLVAKCLACGEQKGKMGWPVPEIRIEIKNCILERSKKNNFTFQPDLPFPQGGATS